MIRRRIFTRHRHRQQRRQAQVTLMLLTLAVVAVWASIGTYQRSAPSFLVRTPPPLNMACAAGCTLTP